ncbi:MAG: LCP family protein [Anaerolineae bacterium]|nr:LCP family protein [Anaerolineae bacterium]
MRLSPLTFLLAIIALAAATIVCSIVGYTTAYSFSVGSVQTFDQQPVFDGFLRAQPTPTLPPTAVVQSALATANATSEPTTIAEIVPTPTLDPLADIPEITDPRRITILILGIDQRAGETGSFRSDTMILVSIDPARKTAGVLSIPRDLWVTIPGYQSGRINTANELGDAYGFPGGGPALAAATVELNLGIEIDNYVRVNFDVFTQVVNTLAPDGIEVCPTEPIDDPKYPDAGYGTISVHFDAGCQRLDATHLLQYARTRATRGADFDRARRQQEVLSAFREEVLSAGGLANIIGQIPTLWEQVSSNVTTNLSLNEILSLAQLAQDIPRSNITFGVIDNLYVDLAQTNTGDQVLLPRQTSMNFLLQQVFNPQGDLSLSDLRARAEAENAEIVVFNNTDVAGLAGQTRDWLTSRGVPVANVGNTATPNSAPTVVRDYGGKVWTARYLAALLGLPPDRVQPGADGATTADVMVVAGPDIQSLLAGN